MTVALGATCAWPPPCGFAKACNYPGAKWLLPGTERHFCPMHRRMFDGSLAGADAPRDSRSSGDTSHGRGSVLHRDPVAEPTLLFPRRMIEDALEQAKKLGKASTLPQFECALEALHWLLDRGNWRDKAEFIATFDWCAHWWRGSTGPIEAEKVRVEYLQRLDRALSSMYRSRRDHARRERQRRVEQLSLLWADGGRTGGGLPEVETMAAGGCATVALMPAEDVREAVLA